MAPTLASKPKICLHLVVYPFHQTAHVFEESSLLGPKPLFKSFTNFFGRLEVRRGASPRDYFNSIYANERSTVSYIHDFGGCEVNVEIFDRPWFRREFQGCSTVEKYLPIVVEVLRKVMEIPRYARGGTLLADYIRSAMSQNRAGQMRGDLFAAFRRYEVNLAAERGVGLSDVALSHNHSLQDLRMLMEEMEEDPMMGLAWDHQKADVQLVRYSGLGLSDESIINPMTNSDGMDKHPSGKRKEDLFGPKDNLAVGPYSLSIHQSTNPFTNPELYHWPEAIQRGDGGNSQDGAPVEGAAVHKTHRMKWFDSLVTAGKDVCSSLASLGLGVSPDDLESQGADIPVLERIYHLLSEHDQTFQHWLRDAGTVGASFSAVYASPSLTTQLPAALAFFTILTAMWLPRKRTRTKRVLTKFGALACIAGVLSAMVKYLSPVGMAIAGPLLLIPAGVVILA